MKSMGVNEVREKFLAFFRKQRTFKAAKCIPCAT